MRRREKGLGYAAWPEADRLAWQGLFEEGDILEGRGAGHHWSTATRKTNLKHYDRWLGWLAARGALAAEQSPAERVTETRVIAYARDLMSEVAPKTVESYVRDLKFVCRALAPERDWRWLTTLSSRLKLWARPSRSVALPPLSAARMYQTVLRLLEVLSTNTAPRCRDRLAVRDALMVALLIAAPIRVKNLTMMRLGHHLTRTGETWHIRFAPSEVKNRAALHHVLPEDLCPHLARYIERVRPGLGGDTADDHLWIGDRGAPLAPGTAYQRVRMTTDRLFGTAMSPHAFRTLAATTLAESSRTDALLSRPLLGHRDARTTEAHYIRAEQIEASRAVADTLRKLRRAER